MTSGPLRIIFMGTPEFAVPSLQALLDGPDLVVAVICQPDKKSGRGRKLASPPVKTLAEAHDIPVLQPPSIRTDSFLDLIRVHKPDLIAVAAYGKILPGALLRLPQYGTINVHGSLLPKYRGAAPIQWAVINGERETGVTIMQMDEGMDTGDILLSIPAVIDENDTAGTMFARLAEKGGLALTEALALLKQGRLVASPQDDRLASEAPMLSKEMGHLDWSCDAWSLHCLIRGLDPWPSAYGFYQGKRYRFFSPRLVPGKVGEAPGTLCRADEGGLLIATGREYLLVREIQPEGKKRLPTADFLRGNPLPAGERFT